MPSSAVAWHPANKTIREQLNKRNWLQTMKIPSGIYALIIALMLCDQTPRIDAYGFDGLAAKYPEYCDSRRIKVKHAKQYHYFDNCPHGSKDALDGSALCFFALGLKGYPFQFHNSTNGPGQDWRPDPAFVGQCLPATAARNYTMAIALAARNYTMVTALEAEQV